ncbi:MAG TPA: DUF3098 domain-containing protein [Saprospiraceae bacterium]|nr:DUF3098 domain-containing protein [Saprospiraceae bacterium]
MSDQKPPKKKKVVVTTKKQVKTSDKAKSSAQKGRKTGKSTTSRRQRELKNAKNAYRSEMIISNQQLYIMLAGLGIILLGLILMSGGAMPDPTVWDEDIIYSPRRLTLAPILILAGMGVEIYAIFKGGK